MNFQRMTGFTLIEAMIVVGIIAILAAIAYPSYLDQVRKSRRSDAKATLQSIQLAQEKWRANHTAYTDALTDLGYAGDENQDSGEGWYKVTVSGANGTSYLITATAQKDQANDTGCTPMTLNQSGTKTPTTCW